MDKRSRQGDRPQAQAAAARGPGPAEELLLLPREDRRGRLQELQPAAAVRVGEGQDPVAPDHRRLPPPPGADRRRGQAGARDGAAALRRELGHGGRAAPGRREGRPPRRGRVGRARLHAQLPRSRDGSPSRRRRRSSPSSRRRDAERAATRRAASSRRRRSPRRSTKTVLRFEVKAGPRASSSARSRRPTSPTSSGASARSGSTAGRSTSTSRSSASAATRSRSRSSRTSRVDVKTLVVPEGGELDAEEERRARRCGDAPRPSRRRWRPRPRADGRRKPRPRRPDRAEADDEAADRAGAGTSPAADEP